MPPQTRYARSGDVNIAYQVVGDGPIDLVLVPGWISNIETFWEEPSVARFLEKLASFSRLILFDKRGTGLSDRSTHLPSLEVRMDDVRAVMDAVGSQRAALLGYSEGGPMCLLFAATYPQRASALITIGSFPAQRAEPGYPGRSPEILASLIKECETGWGGPVALAARMPSRAGDEPFSQWWSRFLRQGASPSAAVELLRMNYEIDVRHLLPSVRVPTLLLHSVGDQAVSIGLGRYMAERIPGAKMCELPGRDHLPFGEDADRIIDEIEEFLTGSRHEPELDRVLATVLFTDIVGSTERATQLGDQRWRDLLQSHHGAVRRELTRFRGREIDTAGDGFFATFDGPARGVRCAQAIGSALQPLGVQVRAGLHTGECEIMGDKVAGIAVNIGARVAALASANEVLVSSTVKDLVSGSGLHFNDRGSHRLKGIEGDWRLYSVVA